MKPLPRSSRSLWLLGLLLLPAAALWLFWPSSASAPASLAVAKATASASAPTRPLVDEAAAAVSVPTSPGEAKGPATDPALSRDPAVRGPWADPSTSGVAGEGMAATAEIEVAGRRFTLTPDAYGRFPRVYVAPGSEARVAVRYADATAAEPVLVRPHDGGELIEAGTEAVVHQSRFAKSLHTDASGGIRFGYKTDQASGSYTVSLRLRDDQKQIEFWVGQPPRMFPVLAAQ